MSRIGVTTSGLSVWPISRRSIFPSSRWRTTLMELPVEPADPPTNMSAKSESRRRGGQRAKSALASPVVVMIETTWNVAERTAASPSAMP